MKQGRAITAIFLVLVIIHGLIHLFGFIKAFDLAEIGVFTQSIPESIGILWLISTLLFLIASALILSRKKWWWIPAIFGVILSQILIIISWQDAKFGTILNLIILVPILIAFINALPSSLSNIYKSEVRKRLVQVDDQKIIDVDIQYLPDPVQKYLRYTGVIGKPKVNNFRAEFDGAMKQKREGKWMDIYSEQYNFYDDNARLFYIKSSILGIPFDGLHKYVGNKAIMQIKVASLFFVVDAKGKEMDQSDTVTLFNDMCVFTPAALIDKSIQWRQIDSLTVKAKFINKGIEVKAILYLNEKGELINFASDDRYLTENGKDYVNYRWSTPVSRYVDFDGRKIPTHGEAIWHTPEGEFSYAKFDLKEIKFNVEKFQEVKV
jgi:hypothetical protein